MCKWGNSIILKLEIPAHLSHTGKAYIKKVGIDKCIAPIVELLNKGGMKTIASCCGHGKALGNIVFADGREILISPNFQMTRKIERVLIENNLMKVIN